MATPKAGWTQTDDVVKWAEEFANFLAREKTQAQKCLHDCERLLNDPTVKSDSLKEGLRDLMSKTEDNFGTLLHLERVLNMKNLGDSASSSTATSSTPMSISTDENNPAQIRQTGRFRQHRVRSMDFGGGNHGARDGSDDAFDPLKDELLFAESSEGHLPHSSREETDDFDEDSGNFFETSPEKPVYNIPFL